MVLLEEMVNREITGSNYITSVNGMLHPDRIMDEHDFLYILEGEWEIWEDGVAYHMKADDLLILKANSHHYGIIPCNPGNRHMYFHILPTKDEVLYNKQSDKNNDNCDISDNLLELPTLIHCAGAPQVKRYFHDLISVYWSNGEKKENQLSLLCNLIINSLKEISSSHTDGIAGDLLVDRVCQKLRTSPQQFFTAREIADEFFICSRTLNNRFKKIFDQSFYSYQMDLKLNMVKQYLRSQPGATLGEAAANFGFCDEFHLSHAFKKQFGISPSVYRKEI